MRKKFQGHRRNIREVSGCFGRELADDHNHVIATELLLDSCTVVTSCKCILQYNPPPPKSGGLSFDSAENHAEIQSSNSKVVGKKQYMPGLHAVMQHWSIKFKWKTKAPEILKSVESLTTGHKENLFLLSKGGLALLVTAETYSLSLGDPSES